MASTPNRSPIGKSALLLICVCLLLASCTSGGAGTQTPAKQAGFHGTVKTTDRQFVIQFSVTPNRPGLNTFTVNVEHARSGKPAPGLQVRIVTTMLDMAMGTDQVDLQPEEQGQFSAQGSLSMSGRWDIRVLLRTPDALLHQADVELHVSP